MLSLFGQIIRDQNSMENKIAYKQIAIYDLISKSWFSKLKMVLMKYGLPEAFHLLQNPPNKLEWKTMVDKKVNQFWIDSLVEDKNSKSSLNLMSVNTCKIRQYHPVWKTARILTGTYTLQSNRAKFNQHDVDPTCLLCKEGPENRQHFILTCKLTEPGQEEISDKNYRYCSILKIRCWCQQFVHTPPTGGGLQWNHRCQPTVWSPP